MLLRVLRVALLVAGLGLVAWLVHGVGAARVAEAMDQSGPWLPLVVLLEAGMIGTDYLASRALVGSGVHAPAVVWARATTLAYAMSILLPTGRAAGEATRAATLAPSTGVGRASGACTRLQAAVLFGNAAACLVIAAAVYASAASATLAWAVLANAGICAVTGSVLMALVRSARFKAWLRARFPRFAEKRAAGETPLPAGAHVSVAVLYAVAGRALQAVQYGVALRAVGAVTTPVRALIAQGIHLVGASVGDAVPNQMGATEGAYRVFASALGLADALPRALSIALVVRIAQLALATVCLVFASLAARQPRPAEAR